MWFSGVGPGMSHQHAKQQLQNWANNRHGHKRAKCERAAQAMALRMSIVSFQVLGQAV